MHILSLEICSGRVRGTEEGGGADEVKKPLLEIVERVCKQCVPLERSVEVIKGRS